MILYKAGDDNLYIRYNLESFMKKSLIFLSLLFLLPLVSAEFLFSQTQEVYSFGDRVNAQLTVTSDYPESDFLEVNLECSQNTLNLYRSPLSFSGQGQKSIDLSFDVTPAILGSLSGTCVFSADYAGQQKASSQFLITREIIIEPSFEKTSYKPDEVLRLTGTARTPNGRSLQGYADLSFSDIHLSAPMTAGRFSFNFTLPHAFVPGEHELSVHIYEKSPNGEVTNEGTFVKTIRIAELLDKLTVVPSSTELLSGDNITVEVFAFNQVQAPVSGDVALTLVNPEGKTVSSKIVSSGTVQHFYFDLNATPGVWTLQASSEGKTDSVPLSMLEHELATFYVENETLIVSNVGNVPYSETLEIAFNSLTVVREVSVPFGSVRKFKLSAPDAEYTITVRDGQQEYLAQHIPLTGRAIDVGQYGLFDFSQLYLPGAIILALLVAFVAVRMYNSRRIHYSDEPLQPRIRPVTNTVALTSSSFSEGQKEDAVILALSLGQRPEHEEGITFIGDFRSLVKSSGGYLEDEGTVLLGIYTQRIAGPEFMQKAVKTGWAASQKIAEYNRLARYKVKAGLGLSDGQLITGYEGKKLSYASVQNTIGRAKNLAAQSRGDLLIPDSLYHKIVSDIRAVRAEKGWKVTSVKDSEQHTKFINSFMKRNDFRNTGLRK